MHMLYRPRLTPAMRFLQQTLLCVRMLVCRNRDGIFSIDLNKLLLKSSLPYY